MAIGVVMVESDGRTVGDGRGPPLLCTHPGRVEYPAEHPVTNSKSTPSLSARTVTLPTPAHPRGNGRTNLRAPRDILGPMAVQHPRSIDGERLRPFPARKAGSEEDGHTSHQCPLGTLVQRLRPA